MTANPDGVRLLALADDELAGWARNWHWNDCASDHPVDPSIYFRDMRMLKAFIDHCRAAPVPQCDAEPDGWREALEAAQSAMADGGIEDTPFVRLALKKINRVLRAAPARCDAGSAIPRAAGHDAEGGWKLDVNWLTELRDKVERATGYSVILECVEETILQTMSLATPPAVPAGEEVRRAKDALFNLARMHGYRFNDVELSEAVRAVARALSPSSNGKPATENTNDRN